MNLEEIMKQSKGLLNVPVHEKKTAGQRIKDNLSETKDDILVWLLSSLNGWLLILSIIGFVALWIYAGVGIAFGIVVAVWILRFVLGYMFNE
ncbi:MAG: hypothetical protein K2O30_01795 [Duncaniella sp.]|nr:hypothetical protein [Duncaniella sp.]MDE7144869.1 hypothetical protein [Duncaniella sp.]